MDLPHQLKASPLGKQPKLGTVRKTDMQPSKSFELMRVDLLMILVTPEFVKDKNLKLVVHPAFIKQMTLMLSGQEQTFQTVLNNIRVTLTLMYSLT